MRHVTVRIFWPVAMADMVRLNRLFLQQLQVQALPEWRQDPGSRRRDGRVLFHNPADNLVAGGQRRSPSDYAWQDEVAAGKLVVAANRRMGKEVDGGARCRLRKATANQITALRYISEAVGVKSVEKVTTKLREDLGTPSLAEALRTAEWRLQISKQRVAALEASLTRLQNLRMHGESIRASDIFAGGAAYSGAEREATLREPFLNAGYHVQKSRPFVCELEQHSQVRKLNIVTHERSESQLDQLERLKAE